MIVRSGCAPAKSRQVAQVLAVGRVVVEAQARGSRGREQPSRKALSNDGAEPRRRSGSPRKFGDAARWARSTGSTSFTQPQIGGAEDARAEPRRSVDPGPAHCRDAVHELGLADAAQRLRTVRAMEGEALREHRLHDLVAGLRDLVADLVAEEDLLLEAQERRGGHRAEVPQVMVRVDDREVGLEHRLRVFLGEPPVEGFVRGMRHGPMTLAQIRSRWELRRGSFDRRRTPPFDHAGEAPR